MSTDPLIQLPSGVSIRAGALLDALLACPPDGPHHRRVVKESLTTGDEQMARLIAARRLVARADLARWDWERDLVDGVPMDEIVDAIGVPAPDPGAELARHTPRQLEGDTPTEGIGSD